jgi:hypothetical protein
MKEIATVPVGVRLLDEWCAQAVRSRALILAIHSA